jgi:hypothetical protein
MGRQGINVGACGEKQIDFSGWNDKPLRIDVDETLPRSVAPQGKRMPPYQVAQRRWRLDNQTDSFVASNSWRSDPVCMRPTDRYQVGRVDPRGFHLQAHPRVGTHRKRGVLKAKDFEGLAKFAIPQR